MRIEAHSKRKQQINIQKDINRKAPIQTKKQREKGGKKGTKNLPKRARGNGFTRDKPERAETEQSFKSSYEEDDPGRDMVTQDPGEETHILSEVFGESQVVELNLVQLKLRFEGCRVIGICECVPSKCLDPDGRN